MTPSPNTPMYLMMASIILGQLVAAIFTFVKWLGSRTVEREDKDREQLIESLQQHDKRFDEENKRLLELDRAVLTLQSEVSRAHEIVSTIRQSVSEIRAALDTRLERQAEMYRAALKEHAVELTEKIENLEFQLRIDTTRTIERTQAYKRKK